MRLLKYYIFLNFTVILLTGIKVTNPEFNNIIQVKDESFELNLN